MIDLAATLIIIVGSTLLFGYWFRYTCLLILGTKTTRDYGGEVAAANQLSFLEVQSQLRQGSAIELDRLHAALERDYAVVTYLLKHSAHATGEESTLELRMLAINYGFKRVWFRVCQRVSQKAARRALEEMSLMVAHLANVMGERAACS